METNISCGFNKIIREKIAAYLREEHQLKQRLSALPAIFRHRFKSCEMHIKGFNYFFAATEIACCELALALYKTVPAEAYSRIGDKELQKFGDCLNTEQRWYALSLANALSVDGITKPALPHLEKFHVMRLHPLGTYESYADMIVRIFRYRQSSAFAA